MIPKIGSEWKAKDGRLMVVDDVITPTIPGASPWAMLTVLNPTKGMRRRTTMSTTKFGNSPTAFLVPATHKSTGAA